MDRVWLGVFMLVAGLALLAYRRPLGERARERGAAFGEGLYVVAGALLAAFGIVEIVADLL